MLPKDEAGEWQVLTLSSPLTLDAQFNSGICANDSFFGGASDGVMRPNQSRMDGSKFSVAPQAEEEGRGSWSPLPFLAFVSKDFSLFRNFTENEMKC